MHHLTDRTNRRGRTRCLARGAMAMAAVAAALVLAPTPAAQAAVLQTGDWSTTPISWVDGQGRQYVVSYVPVVNGTGSPTKVLVIARDRADGTPDTSWGTDGRRPLTIAAPAGLVVREGALAASDDGTITTTWRGYGCDAASSCTRWFLRSDANGDPVGSAVRTTSDAVPAKGLPDGSFLTRAADGAVGWWGADGVDRGFPALGGAVATSVTVDHAGRLLVATSTGHVLRKPPGAAADLDLDLSATCTATGNALRVGRASADDGFVTVCTRPGNEVEITRRSAAGATAWSTTVVTDDPAGHLTSPTSVLADDQDRVWVGGYGDYSPALATAGVSMVQPFTQAGAERVAYVRNSPHFQAYETRSDYIVELRQGPGHKVAMVDHYACCTHSPGLQLLQSVVTAIELPQPEGPPTCAPKDPLLTHVGVDEVTLRVTACLPPQPANSRPLQLRAELTDAAGDVVASASQPAPQAPSPPFGPMYVSSTVGDVPSGRLLHLTVRGTNEDGAGTPSNPIDVVLPFVDVDTFVTRQHRDLRGTAPSSTDLATLRASLHDGTLGTEDVATIMLDDGDAAAHVEPVARLYRAVFGRDPDLGGLTYWWHRHHAGTPLQKVADTFAASPEFQRRYGTLTNRAFVAALYANVFGRTADRSGLDHWSAALDRHALTRGGLVRQLSESPEGVRRAQPIVAPLATAVLMLHRLPTPAERTAWAAFAEPHRQVAKAILRSAEYATMIASGH